MDEAGHELDVQVVHVLERVMCASVACLGYEWRRTKKRDRETVVGDFATSQS